MTVPPDVPPDIFVSSTLLPASQPPLASNLRTNPSSGVASSRDTSRDGLRNSIETALLTQGRPAWRFVNRTPWLARPLNRLIVKNAASKLPARPLRLSTMADYPSWSSLTDRNLVLPLPVAARDP